MSVEHDQVDASACSPRPGVGKKGSVIPGHQGKLGDVHAELVGSRNGEVQVFWIIRGRGKVK